MRALDKARPVQCGISVQRTNVRIVVELIQESVDPPRDYPLVGPAQLHHAHYKCIVYFTEVQHLGGSVPHTTTDEDCQDMVYIDHDHLHMLGEVDPSSCAGSANPTGRLIHRLLKPLPGCASRATCW